MKKTKQLLTWLLIMTFVLSSSVTSIFAIDVTTPSLTGLAGTSTGVDEGNFTWDLNLAGYSVDEVRALLNGNPQVVDINSGLLSLTGLESATNYELSLAVDLSKTVEKCFIIEKKIFNEDITTTVKENITAFGKKSEINQGEQGSEKEYQFYKHTVYGQEKGEGYDTLLKLVQSYYPGYTFVLPEVTQDKDSGWDRYIVGEVTFTKTENKDITKYALEGTLDGGTWYATYEEARDAQLGAVEVYTEGEWYDDDTKREVCYDETIPFKIEAQKANFTTGTEYFTVKYDADGGNLVSGLLDNSVAKHGSVTEPVVNKPGHTFVKWQYDTSEFDLEDITFNLNAIAIYTRNIIDEQPPTDQPPQQTPPTPQQPVINYTLTVNVVNGTVPGFEGTNVFSSGTNVNLSAIAESELYEFIGWSGDLVSTNLNDVVVMTGDKVVTATFALIQEPVPEAPPVEQLVVELTADNGVEIDTILDDVTPQEAPTELPQTSGIPAIAFSMFGSALMGFGSVIRKKMK